MISLITPPRPVDRKCSQKLRTNRCETGRLAHQREVQQLCEPLLLRLLPGSHFRVDSGWHTSSAPTICLGTWFCTGSVQWAANQPEEAVRCQPA